MDPAHLPHANTHKLWADAIQGVRKSAWFLRFEGERLFPFTHAVLRGESSLYTHNGISKSCEIVVRWLFKPQTM